MEETSRRDEEIIELTQVVSDESTASKTQQASTDEGESHSPLRERARQALSREPSFSPEDISDELIENVIEKWIQKEFQHKIEPLMQDAVERVLHREIRRIKWDIEKKMSRIQMVAEKE